jgi:hypothetical protein
VTVRGGHRAPRAFQGTLRKEPGDGHGARAASGAAPVTNRPRSTPKLPGTAISRHVPKTYEASQKKTNTTRFLPYAAKSRSEKRARGRRDFDPRADGELGSCARDGFRGYAAVVPRGNPPRLTTHTRRAMSAARRREASSVSAPTSAARAWRGFVPSQPEAEVDGTMSPPC